MHRIWEFPVKSLLRDCGNELKVVLYSPTRFIREAYGERPMEGSSDAMQGFPYLRKASLYVLAGLWVPASDARHLASGEAACL